MSNQYPPNQPYYGYHYAPPGFVPIYPSPQYPHDPSTVAHAPPTPTQLSPQQHAHQHASVNAPGNHRDLLTCRIRPVQVGPSVSVPPELPHEQSTSSTLAREDGSESPVPAGSNAQDVLWDRAQR